MIANKRFLRQAMPFWANVRSISEKHGYTERGTQRIKVPTLVHMQQVLTNLELESNHVVNARGQATPLGQILLDYFEYRADRLNNFVEPNLMNAQQAKEQFDLLRKRYKSTLAVPMNKQSGDKKQPAYLTGLVNLLVEAHCGGLACDYAPNKLTTFTRNGQPLRTLARRVDGAFPSTVNPVAIWEIKEYYYTTTFGSRVADGVYETLLDGMELQELYENEQVTVKHYLMVDAHFTWWEKGRSYLCRIFDMLHMGLIDEALFGREVIERLPILVEDWAKLARQRGHRPDPNVAIYRSAKAKPASRRVKEKPITGMFFELGTEASDNTPAGPAEA